MKLIEVITTILESGDKRHAKHIQWADVAAQMAWRDGKQCRDRWYNQLDPSIRRGMNALNLVILAVAAVVLADPWTPDEEAVVFEAQRAIGNKWCDIAKMLPGRTENSVKNLWNSHKRRLSRQTAVHPRDLGGEKIPALSSLGAPITQEARQRARGIVQAEIEKCPSILQPPKSRGREPKGDRRAAGSVHGAAAAQRSFAHAHASQTATVRAHAMATAHHHNTMHTHTPLGVASTSTRPSHAVAQAHIAQMSAALVAAVTGRGAAGAHTIPAMHSSAGRFGGTVPMSAGTFSQPARARGVGVAEHTLFQVHATAPGGSATGLPDTYSDHEDDEIPSPSSQHNSVSHLPFHPTPTLDTSAVPSDRMGPKGDSGGVPFLKLPPFAELLDDDAVLVPHGPPAIGAPRMSPGDSPPIVPHMSAPLGTGDFRRRGRGGTASTHDGDDAQSSVSGSAGLGDETVHGDGASERGGGAMLPPETHRGPPLTEAALASMMQTNLTAEQGRRPLGLFRPHIVSAARFASDPGRAPLFPPFVASSPPQLIHCAAQLGSLYAAAYNEGFKAGSGQCAEDASFSVPLSPTVGSTACELLAAAQLSRNGWSHAAISEHMQGAASKPSQATGDPLPQSSKKSTSPHSSLAASSASPSRSADTPAQRRGSVGGAPSESPRPFADNPDDALSAYAQPGPDRSSSWGEAQGGEGGGVLRTDTSKAAAAATATMLGHPWHNGTEFVVPGIGLRRGALGSAAAGGAPPLSLPRTSSPGDGFVGSILAAVRGGEVNTFTPPSGLPPDLGGGLSAPGSPGQSGLGLTKSSALTRSPGSLFLHSPDTLAKAPPPSNEDFGFLPSPAKDGRQ